MQSYYYKKFLGKNKFEILKILYNNIDPEKWYKAKEFVDILLIKMFKSKEVDSCKKIALQDSIGYFRRHGYFITKKWNEIGYKLKYSQEKSCKFSKISIKGLYELYKIFKIKSINNIETLYVKELLLENERGIRELPK